MQTDDMKQLVHTSTRSWKDMVQKAAGKDWNKPDVVYEFSNGRKFESTDASGGGPYEAAD